MANTPRPSVGQPRLPLRWLYVPAVLNILTVGAKALCEKHVVTPTMHENTITIMLEREMRCARTAGIIRGHESDIISWFIRPIVPDETIHDPLATGEVDLLFTWGTYRL